MSNTSKPRLKLDEFMDDLAKAYSDQSLTQEIEILKEENEKLKSLLKYIIGTYL